MVIEIVSLLKKKNNIKYSDSFGDSFSVKPT